MSTDSNEPSRDSDAQLDEVLQELKALFEYSPPTLTLDPTWGTPGTRVPFWLYDKHLDRRLNLLHVESLSSLPESLAAVVDDTIKSITQRRIKLPPIERSFPGERWRRRRHPIVTDSGSVAEFYRETTSASCLVSASMLAAHPRAPSWTSSLNWGMMSEATSAWSAWVESFSLRLNYSFVYHELDLEPGIEELLGDKTLRGWRNAAARLPDMATWLIGPVSSKSENILRDMDRVISSTVFRPNIPSTIGHSPTTRVLPEPPDAAFSPWEIDESTIDDTRRAKRSQDEHILPRKQLRRSARLHSAVQNTKRSQRREQSKKYLAGTESRLGQQSPAPGSNLQFIVLPGTHNSPFSDTEQLIQHAWAQSVRKDTSLIIFSCGNFERIGIRHRKSQTLYLSDLIDVANDKDPPYGKLHLGLYIAAFRDTLDRAGQLQNLELSPSRQFPVGTSVKGLKRPAAEKQTDSNKRARKERDSSNALMQDPNTTLQEVGLRNLALLRFQYGVYNSSSPSSFLRVGSSLSPSIGPTHSPRLHRKYMPHEYFTIDVLSSIGYGATGIVHKGKLTMNDRDGPTVECDVVVKFAFMREQQERMRHEYSIYARMAASGVTGVIVGVLGLFNDVEGGALALIMTHGGTPLEDRIDKIVRVESIEEREAKRTAFLRAVGEIHKAGVCHQDLRAPNLLVNESGGVAIVDFDIANTDASKDARKQEIEQLKCLLNSIYGLESDSATETGTASSSTSSQAKSIGSWDSA
ncbi:hypothetical protein Hypma_003520 [Hypsizygus marmoreus]|uniref:Protein kinase domain-containing protein n=1 Tax=Hypsizygus marmoreus TaxID=39966 RepID=A0A369J880_HYPMA|nr:hypothetical protein Hypma_003520 [Hypsizygus marmoreus]